MNLILNRDFKMPDDGWYQLAPLGEFPHATAGVVQVVDVEACTAMVARFKADAAVENFAGLLVDFDHFSLSGERRSEAAGWITALEARAESGKGQAGSGEAEAAPAAERAARCGAGLWAQIRWSDLGEAAVKGGRYRFLSPVWARNDCVDLGPSAHSTSSGQADSGQVMARVRPVRLLNAAVTNDPNLKGLVPLANASAPLSAGSGPVDSCASYRGVHSAVQKGDMTMKRVIEKLMNHLGLQGDATEEAVLEKMAGLPALTVVVDLQNSLKQAQDERDALKGTLKGVEGELVNRHLAEFEGVVTEKTKGFWTEQLMANRARALAALGDLKLVAESGKGEAAHSTSSGQGGGEAGAQGRDPSAGSGQARKPLHNRAAARPVIPGVGDGSPSTGSGSADGRAAKIRNRAQEIVAAEKIPFIVAFRRAEREGAGQ
jgi:phage I-like protein